MTASPDTSTAALAFERASGRGVSRTRELARPLPPTLAGFVPDDATAHHRQLGERFGAATGAALAADRAVAEAERADRAAAADAARNLKPLPKESAPAAVKRRGEAQRELAAVTQALAESADGLLALAVPVLADATKAADEHRAQTLEQVTGLLEAARDGLARSAALAHEAGWIRGAAEAAAAGGRARVTPYAPGGQPSEAANLIGQAIEHLAGDEQRRHESAEWHRRQREAADQLPPPPGRFQAGEEAS